MFRNDPPPKEKDEVELVVIDLNDSARHVQYVDEFEATAESASKSESEATAVFESESEASAELSHEVIAWTGKSLKKYIKQARHNGNRLDLKKANLSGIQEKLLNLHYANLYQANLSRAWMLYSDLSCADLCSANLSSIMLTEGSLKRAWLYDANLEKAYLRLVDMRGAHCVRASFAYANLSSVQAEGVDFSSANLWVVNFSGANVTNANFSKANLTGAIFRNAILTKANFTGAEFFPSRLTNKSMSELMNHYCRFYSFEYSGTIILNDCLRTLRMPMCQDLINKIREIKSPYKAIEVLKIALESPLFKENFNKTAVRIYNFFSFRGKYQNEYEKMIRAEITRIEGVINSGGHEIEMINMAEIDPSASEIEKEQDYEKISNLM